MSPLPGAVHSRSFFSKKRGIHHGNDRNPHILAAKESIAHIEEPVSFRDDTGQPCRNQFGNGHDDDSIGQIDGNIFKGNIFSPPVSRSQRLTFFRYAVLQYGVNMGDGYRPGGKRHCRQ